MAVTSVPAVPAAPVAAARRPRRARRRARRAVAVVVAVALAAVVGGWLAVGGRPTLVAGSWSAVGGGVTWVGDGVATTRFLLEGPGTGTVRVSLRNESLVPVTLLGPAAGSPQTRPGHPVSMFSRMRWGAVRAGDGPAEVALGDGPVRLARGQEAYVELDVRPPPCTAYDAGSSVSVDTLPLMVTSLGLTTTVDAPLGLPVTVRFRKANIPAASCP